MKDNKDANSKYKVLSEEDQKESKTNPSMGSIRPELELEITQNFQTLKDAFKSNNARIEKLQEENDNLKEEFIRHRKENQEAFNSYSKNLSSKLEKFNKELSMEIKQDIEAQEEKKEEVEIVKLYKEGVDGDSYLYLSVVLSYNALFLMVRFLFQGLCKKEVPLGTKVWGFFSILLAPLLLIPGLMTPVIQTVSFLVVLEDATKNFTGFDKDNLMVIKVMILVVFVLMVSKEASQAINSMFYCYFEAKEKKTYFLSGCFIPQFIQILMTFFLLYVSILLIFSTNDAINLIQNFAALYILLEIDNIVMEFVRLTKFNSILLKIDYGLHGVRKSLNSQEIYSHLVIKKILVEEQIEVDYAAYSKWSKCFFIIVRTLTIAGLIVFGVLIWYFRVENGSTNKSSMNSS